MPKKKFTITVEADLAHAEFPTWYNFHGNTGCSNWQKPCQTSAADFSDYVQQVIISELIADGIARQDLEEVLWVVHPKKEAESQRDVFEGHFDGVSIPPSITCNSDGSPKLNPFIAEDINIDARIQMGLDKALEADDDFDICDASPDNDCGEN